jgi:uncharacterized repeat protein (TIGR01451 family)
MSTDISRSRFARRFLLVFAVLAAFLDAGAALAACVPTPYTVVPSAPSPSSWTDITGTVWSPAGSFPGSGTCDTASNTNITPTTLVINSTFNPLVGVNLACNGCVIEIQSGGSLSLAGTGSIGSGATLKINGGTLTIASGGDLTFQSGSQLVFLGGLLDVQTGGHVTLDGATTVNGGGFIQVSGGTLTVPPTAMLNLQSGSQLEPNTGTIDGGGTINNAGSVPMTGAGLFVIDAIFNNVAPTGSLNVGSGTLSLAGGGSGDAPFNIDPGAVLDFPLSTYTMTPNGVVSGGGTLSITGGTLSIGGVTSPGGFVMSAGTLTGAGFLSITNSMNWSGGTITGSGGAELAGTGSGTISGADGPMTLDGRAFNDYGSIVYNATTPVLTLTNGAALSVYGNFDIQSDSSIDGGSSEAVNVFPNGSLSKNAGSGTTTIHPKATNNSGVSVSNGTLAFAGGGTHSGAFFAGLGATMAFTGGTTVLNGFMGGDGTFLFRSSSTTINGTYAAKNTVIDGNASVNTSVTADTTTTDFTFDGGTFNLGNTFTMLGSGTWSDGTIGGSGTFKVKAGATLTINAATGGPTLDTATLRNEGTVDYTAASPRYLTLMNGAVIDNVGTFDLQSDQQIAVGVVIIGLSHRRPRALSGPPVMNNSGTLQKSCCAGTTDFQPDLANSGSIKAQSGTIGVSGAFSQTAGSTTLGPGNVSSNSTFNMTGGTLAGAGTFTGDVNNNSGNVSPGSSPGIFNITGNYTQGGTGTMTIELAGSGAGQFDQVNVTGNVTLDGTLNVSLLSYAPPNGTVFPVLTFAGRTGDFAAKNLPSYPIGGTLVASYPPSGTELDLTAVVAPLADLQITKSGPAGVTAGQNVVYTVTVKNNGPDAAANVVVSDPTPANLTFVSNAGDCTSAYPCNFPTLNSGQTVVITSTYSTSPSFSGNVTNTAAVSSSTNDNNGANDSSSATTNVGAQADLSIIKTGPASVTPGQNIVYTVQVTNGGPSPATGVSVSDPTPIGLAFQSNTGACGTPYPCSLGTLNAGQTVTITSTYTVPGNYSGASISNTASVSSPTVNDPNLIDNSSTATTTVSQTADLSISKSGPASTGLGSNVSYTITVTNLGPSSAPSPVVSDPTPPGLTFVSNSGACVTPFPCTISNLTAGQSATITATYNVPPSYPSTSISNTASVSSSAGDPASGNNSATATTSVVAQADLSVIKSGPPATGTGSNVVFTVTVTNNGTLTASNAVVSDPTPSGITFVSNTGGCTTPYPCALGNLVSGQTVTTTSTYFVPANYASASIVNTATVSSATTDLNGGNNSSTATVSLGPVAEVGVIKSGPDTVLEGANIVYTIAVKNNGPNTASNIQVSDPTPSGVLFVSNSGACTTPFPCTIASLASGATATITATYKDQVVAGAIIVNDVTISSAADPQSNNNTSEVRTRVVTANTCPAPAKLLAPAAGANVPSPVTFAWSAVAGATIYSVDVSGPVSLSLSSTALTATAPLSAGSYSWSVTAYGIPGCKPVTSAVSTFSVCNSPGAPVASVIGQSTTGQTYAVSWDEVSGATSYELQESSNASFNGPTTFTLTGTSKSFTKDVNQATPFFYRVRAVSPCNLAGEFSPVIRVAVLTVPVPANDANISVPNGSTTPVTFTIFVPGLPGGSTTFVATADKPWLSVVPTSGIVPPDGANLTVQADPTSLTNGTWTGSIVVVYGSVSVTSNGVHAEGTQPTTTIPVSISLVTPVTPVPATAPSASAMVIPSVGHLAGIESNWRSDARIANVGLIAQKYLVTLTGSGDPSALVKQTTISADAGSTIALDDLVRTWYGLGSLGESSSGALVIQPVSTATTAPVVASRTFNAAASGGTLGQFIPAVPFSAFIGAGANLKSILSLQQIAQTDAYRSNLGVVEAAGKPVSALISVFDPVGAKLLEVPLSLNGGEQKQLNGFLSLNGLSLPNGRIEVKALSGAGRLSAYASVVDNFTKDPLYVSGQVLGGTGASRFVVPGVAALDNATANWRSDLRLFNSSTVPVQATLTFYPEGNPAASLSQQMVISPSEVKAVDNAVQSLFKITGGGALHVTTPTDAPLVVTARTYDQTATGTVGQFITAVTAEQGTAAGERSLQILQVEESPRYRANIGLAEMSGKPATVEVSVVLPDSKVSPKLQFTLNPFEFRQLPILSSLGIGAVYNARLTVRVVSGAGRVTGYASVIDRTTGDPTYIQSQ